MKIDYADFVKQGHTVHVQFQKEILNFYKNANVKQDSVTEFINKYVYVEYLNDRQVTMSELSELLNETDNTIRKKIKYLIKAGLIQKIRLANDARVYILKPTKVLIRMYEIQASRMLKTLIETSPVLKTFFGSWSKGFYAAYKTTGIPSYFNKYNKEHYDLIAKQMSDGKMEYLETNTRKKLG